MSKQLNDFVTFKDQSLAAKYQGKKFPLAHLFESYFDGAVDIEGDMQDFLAAREDLVNFQFTPEHVRFFVTRMLPEVAIHSKAQDVRIARDHYDRGNDFFESFLGDRMVYTSAFFKTLDETLEEAQDNKMNLVGEKLQLKPGQRYLDIGCGWGTLVRHAARNFGVDATGVTIAERQVAYAQPRIKADGIEDKARLLCLDYRDIPAGPYDRISCLEMAEHVGIKNFSKFLTQVRDMMTDDGLFYLQIAGLRRAAQQEDRIWGLFMNKYIFPGADASMPLGWVINKLEKAGFEVHSVENVGIHYSHTIQRWYDNWIQNEALIQERYGDRWFRIWKVFLAWSVTIAAQGSSTCFQIVSNKNLNHFNRNRYIGAPQLGEQTHTWTVPAAAAKANGKGKGKGNGHAIQAEG